MQTWNHFVAMVTMAYFVAADFDYNFCNTRMGMIDPDGNNEPPPVFYDDFYVFIEKKNMGNSEVTNIREYYSQHSGQAYVSFDRDKSLIQVWVDIKYNEVMAVPIDSTKCTDVPFAGSDEYMLFGANTDANGVTTLSDPSIALHWGGPNRKNISYKGEDNSRGIKTQKWWTCEYAPYVDATTFTEWQIVDPSQFKLPVVDYRQLPPRPILPISAFVIGLDKSHPDNVVNFTYRYDFAHFGRIQPDDRQFRIPPNMMCANKPNSQKPLPTIPDHFKFRGEMLTILGYGTQQPDSPQLVYSNEEYRHELGLYIQDVISQPKVLNGINNKSFVRLVDDFNTGLTYSLDLESGYCEVSVISDGTVDAIQMGNGLVKMRDSSQFFDLDPNAYQYMGLQELRGITCDAWTAYFGTNQSIHQQNAYYTWYFANPDWMKQNSYLEPFTMPVALVLTQDQSYTQFNIYEFTTMLNRDTPDLSPCYDVNSVINVQVFFRARFAEYYVPAEAGFKQSFLTSLVRVTSLNSTLRVADLDVQPTDDDNIVVRFKLLDKPAFKGDVAKMPVMAPNAQVFQEIVNAINSGKFYINVGETGNAIVYAIPNTVARISSPPSRRTFTPSTSSTSSSGYSSGAMAGVGVGTLVFGLFLGILTIFLVKKLYLSNKNSDMSMKTLSSDQEPSKF
ncbi:uncharacterized protein LOC106068178 [Biomphalaria glabrata]|uniref:Uncharacterized protein LOC106068178 n=1 Tax=Biomphalaria glabrata TaxID=6526 RepID=A0A9W2ZDT6_BIOGL|nr:uncharacterized protein LOC106068178 [Biomphalaria glabrata]